MPAQLQYAQQQSLRDRILGPQTPQVRWITIGSLIAAFFVLAAMLSLLFWLVSGSPFYAVPLAGIVLAVVMRMVRQARQRWSMRVLDHLDTAVRSHADLSEYLQAAAAAESRPVTARLRHTAELLHDGVALHLALASAVPELSIADLRLLALGESTGDLETMLARIIQRHRAQAHQRDSGASLVRLYIPFLIGMIVGVTMLLGIFVMPKYQVILRDFGLKPRGMTAFVLQIPHLMIQDLTLLLLGIAAFLFALYWLLRDIVQTFLPRKRTTLPQVQGGLLAAILTRDRAMAEICWSLAAAARMGLPLATALEDLQHSGFARPIARQLELWRHGLQSGKSDVAAAQDAGMPALLCSVLRIGGPQLPESLALLGDSSDMRHTRRRALLRAILLPLVTLTMAGLALLVALSVFLPLLMMLDHLANNGRTW